MTTAAITFQELLADNESTAAKWRVWFHAHPHALQVLCDVANSNTIGELVHHIFAVELRHSQRLLGVPVTVHDEDPIDTIEQLYAIQEKANSNLKSFLAHADDQQMTEIIHFNLRSGRQVTTSRRKLFAHIMIHAVRHWAQISTLLRQAGLNPSLPGDFLYSSIME